MSNQTRHVTRILLIPSVLLLLAACSGYGTAAGGAGGSPTTASPVAAASGSSAGRGSDYDYGSGASASAEASAASSAAAGLVIGTGAGTVGTYLTGADGMTLYTFKKDSANTSVCTDTCAGNWPPLIVAAGVTPTAGAGVTGALSTFSRADGTHQVAYGGKPLYYFASDTSAGDTNGQGIGGFWFVATP
jgi:predicted lipoprotein with Yx(FWY)xxD motif